MFFETYKKCMMELGSISKSKNLTPALQVKRNNYKVAIRSMKIMKQNGIQSINDFHIQSMKNKDIINELSHKLETLKIDLENISTIKEAIEQIK